MILIVIILLEGGPYDLKKRTIRGERIAMDANLRNGKLADILKTTFY